MDTLHVDIADRAAMERLAVRLARCLPPGAVLALWGDLGAGKTTFARAFIQARLGAAITVPSPTFTLVQSYEGPAGTIYHFDLYRVEAAEEIEELGWEDAMAADAVLIEWPDIAGTRLPARRLDVVIGLPPSGSEMRAVRLQGGLLDRLRPGQVVP